MNKDKEKIKLTSQKLTEKGVNFLKKLRKNRIKADIDDEGLAYWKLIEIIVKYFKLNNDKYLELVKMELENNA